MEPILAFDNVKKWKIKLAGGQPFGKQPNYIPKNIEIFDGHHRTACYAFLGKTKISCQYLKKFLLKI